MSQQQQELPRVVALPPANQGRVALGLTAAAAVGEFRLQVCDACGATQYPPKEICQQCLSDSLVWQPQDGAGKLVGETTLRHSNNAYFGERLPWRVGFVHLDTGPSVMVHVHQAVETAPARVRVGVKLDRAGRAALIAFPVKAAQTEDDRVHEMTSNPQGTRVLVTDGESALGQALAKTLVQAGAARVWLGYRQARGKQQIAEAFGASSQVVAVPLDVSLDNGLDQAANDIGEQLDILINNAEAHHTDGADGSIDAAAVEMNVNYLGLLRLTRRFAPVFKQRDVKPGEITPAWVNVLSVYALANCPSQGTYSASKAAALSLSQCLRAELQTVGVRTLNVFPGPVDDEWSQLLPPPRLAPAALAKAIVKGLVDGVEDIYPDNVSKELLELWQRDAKVLEREMSGR